MLNDFHGNDDTAIDDMIAAMIPEMESALLAGNRQLLPGGIDEIGYAAIDGIADTSLADAMGEMICASVNNLLKRKNLLPQG